MKWRSTSLIVIGLLISGQLMREGRTNPPVHSDVAAPTDVTRALRRACYDCHSNETVWPWYSKVAPFSWLTNHEVDEGRLRLNFSEWDEYASDPDTAAQKLSEIAHLVANGSMPPWYYRTLHSSARLSAAQTDMLARWAEHQTTAYQSAPR